MINLLLCSIFFVAFLIIPTNFSTDFCHHFEKSDGKFRAFLNGTGSIFIMNDQHYWLLNISNGNRTFDTKYGHKYSGFDSNYDELYPAQACCLVNQDPRPVPIIILYDVSLKLNFHNFNKF